jgi:ATP/maltotriose-dependent transcriptional regulator MalT
VPTDTGESGERRLAEAREAHARCDWVAAFDGFRVAHAEGLLGADDFAAMGSTAWWLGDLEESNRCLQEAHRLLVEQGRREQAAAAAMELAVNHYLRGDEALGSGWMGRAARLLEDAPEGPVHAYLAYLTEVEGNFGRVDPTTVLEAARRIQASGHRHGDPTLVAIGISGEARALIVHGRTEAGLKLLDEAMVSVVTGELTPDWVGSICCTAISVCHDLGDLIRMRKWTEATERWLETLPVAVLFAGICRVHRAQLLCVQGEWDRAEREAAAVCEDLANVSVASVAEAWYQIGEIRRLRGQSKAAEEAYRKAHEHGRDPHPGLALLRLAMGRGDEASTAIRTALIATTGDRLTCARLCAAQVEIALATGDVEVARDACRALSDVADAHMSSGLQALAITARGRVLSLEGRYEEALPALREACRIWRELEADYEAARTCCALAKVYRALGDHGAAAMELDAATTVFRRLGADVDAARVAALRESAAAPGGLSEREVEVLRLVASGHTNRKIAKALFISEKTVARHLSNIFTKLNVGSRTDAARYAFEHGLMAR